MSDEKKFTGDHSICHCGTVDDARQAAEELFLDIRGMEDCAAWCLQVATMLRTICIEEVASAVPDKWPVVKNRAELQENIINPLVRYQKEHGTPLSALRQKLASRKYGATIN